MPKPNSVIRSYSAGVAHGNRPFGGIRSAKVEASQLIRTSYRMHGDVELLRLCARFHELERIIQGSWTPENQGSWKVALEEQDFLSAKIAARRPKTLYEFRQIARALVGWAKGMPLDDIADLSSRDRYLLTFLLTSLLEGS